ncbi:MAG: hypothetical protein GOVbin1807_83 [Prokaryotic dsDNA virus sp.]|nr:MAG: hypothetical protein GOVbin1807_83 [Prokaryotic dsDNA virus sp.]|tara:strand:- start:4738 stop:7236 length:2499 start_codon:yes stop_codon:yes gene_type:complete
MTTKAEKSEGVDTAQQAKNAEEMRENLLIALDNAIKLDELEGKKAQKLGQQLDLTQRRLDVSTKLLAQSSNQLRNLIAQKDSLGQTVASAEELQAIFDVVSKKQIEGVQAGAKYKQILKDMADINKKAAGDDAERLRLIRESAKAMEELRAEQEDVKKFGDKFNSQLGNWGSNLGVANNLMSTSSGKISSMVADLTTGLTTDKIAMVGKAFTQFGITTLASIVDEVFKLAIALDTLGKEFKKTNGYAQDFESTIKKIDSNLYAAGLSMEKSVEAMQSLSDTYTDYNPNAVLQNEYMTTTIGLLTSVGVQSGHSAKGIQMLSKTFKMTGEEATDTFQKIVTSGNSAGISNRKMAADFEANFSSLIQFGNRAKQVFKELAAMSKATGVEMSALVGIAQKFDTFEGAATQAAKLNSVLGVNVSAMELMNADYAETIELIRDGMSGVNFDELNRFEQNYLAQAMGAKDVYEAQRLLSGEADEYENKMKAQAETQDELMRIVKENLPVMERLSIAIGKIARAAEIALFPITLLLDLFLFIDDITGGILMPISMLAITIKGLFSAFIAGTEAFWMFKMGVDGIAGLLAELGAAGTAATAATMGIILLLATGWNMVSNALREWKPTFEWLWKGLDFLIMGLLAAAAALVLFSNPVGWAVVLFGAITGAIYAFRKELADLWETFNLTGSPKLYSMPDVFAWGMNKMAIGIAKAKSALQAFGSILVSIHNTAMKPFISAFSKVAGVLGFDMETTEDGSEAQTVTPTGPKMTAGAAGNAIQQAAMEVKTIVVAQLKETGIQETADELAKIAKIMDGKDPITNVTINLDGRPLKDFIWRTIAG